MRTQRYNSIRIIAFHVIHSICLPALLLCLLTPMVHAGNPPVTCMRIPMQFVRNEGQWPEYVKYMLLPAEEQVVLMQDGVMFITKRQPVKGTPAIHEVPGRVDAKDGYDVVIMRFENPSPFMRIEQGAVSETKVNFCVGDTETWRENVPCIDEIIYRNVWDGVDIAFRTEGEGFRAYISDIMAYSKILYEGERASVDRLKTSLLTTQHSSGMRNSEFLLNSIRRPIPDRLPSDSTYYWTEYASFFPTSKGDSARIAWTSSDALSRLTIASGTRFPDLPTTANAWQLV